MPSGVVAVGRVSKPGREAEPPAVAAPCSRCLQTRCPLSSPGKHLGLLRRNTVQPRAASASVRPHIRLYGASSDMRPGPPRAFAGRLVAKVQNNSQCAFRGIPATDSTASRPPIPGQSGH